MQKTSQPLNLTGAKNVRDLGGYPTKTGAVTRTHAFLRSDALHRLTEEDCRTLFDYGVRCIIDLRSLPETQREPGLLHQRYPQIEYVHVPIQDHIRANRYSDEFPPSMWQLYCWFLDDGGAQFRQVFAKMLEYPDNCVLFHCSGGKDRTGMIAMLLLKLAGVDDETIIEDYAITESLMKDIFVLQTAQLEAMGLVVPPYVMQSPRDNMVRALAHFDKVYGTAQSYFSHLGFSDEQIDALKRKLISQ